MSEPEGAAGKPLSRSRRIVVWGVWFAVLIAVTAIMVAVRARLDRVHVTLA